MRIRRLLVPFLAAALFGPFAAAQVTFTGVLEKATLATFCQEESHYLTCTGPDPFSPSGVLVKSSTLDLTSAEGKNARFTAVLRGVECPIYDIIDVQIPPPASLVYCGSPVPGCPMRFRVGPTGVIGQFWLYYSFSPNFQPVDPIFGTILIGSPIRFLGSGNTVGTDEEASVNIVVPPNVSLTGLDLWLQGARRDVGPIGPLMLTNAVCFTILGPSPPCHVPDC